MSPVTARPVGRHQSLGTLARAGFRVGFRRGFFSFESAGVGVTSTVGAVVSGSTIALSVVAGGATSTVCAIDDVVSGGTTVSRGVAGRGLALVRSRSRLAGVSFHGSPGTRPSGVACALGTHCSSAQPRASARDRPRLIHQAVI